MEFKQSLLPAAISAIIAASIYAPVSLALEIPQGGYTVGAGQEVTLDEEDAFAYGALEGENISGNIINQGTINGKDWYGIDIEGFIAGDIINKENGVIKGDVAIVIEGSAGNIINEGLISGGWIGILADDVDEIVNSSSGIISGGEVGISIDAAGLINNNGSISGGEYGVAIDGVGPNDETASIVNGATGTISGGISGIFVDLNFGTIQNDNVITGGEHGIHIDGHAELITNSSTGLIEGGKNGIFIEDGFMSVVDVIQNEGTIKGDQIGINADGEVGILSNLEAGEITGGDIGISANDSIDIINNSGLIAGGAIGVELNGDLNELNNLGVITGGEVGINIGYDGAVTAFNNSNLIEGGSKGISFEGFIAQFLNEGIIRATADDGTAVHVKGGYLGYYGESESGFINTGLIESLGNKGIALHIDADEYGEYGELGDVFLNEGTIRGGDFAVKYDSDVEDVLENTGLIDGKVFGEALSLNNSGTFRTEQGSSFASYQGSGEIIAVLSNSTAADQPVIDVEGKATLEAGSAVLVEGKKNDFTATIQGNEYIILEAGELDIVDETLNVGTNSSLLEVTLAGTDNNQITVVVKANNASDIIGQAGATAEEKAFINSFQHEVIANMSEDDAVYKMFEEAQKDVNNLKDFAGDLQPDASGSDAAAATATQSVTFSSIASRTDALRSGVSSGDMYQSGGVWTQLLHSKGTQDARGQSNGFTSHITGITIGADAALDDYWTVGAALTAAEGTTNIKNSSNSTETDSIIASLYGSWQSNDWFADVIASVGRTGNEGERLNKLIESDYDADQYGLRLTLGRDVLFGLEDILIQPTVSFNYGRVDIESYEEKGSAAALSVESQRYETIELGAGVKGIKSIDMDRGVLNASVSLNGWHDFAADQIQTESRFLMGSTILTTTGESPEKTTWQVGMGVEYLADNNLTYYVSYDHTWKSSFKADTISAKVRYDF